MKCNEAVETANNPEQDYTLKIGANGREMGVGALRYV